jgi:hypothetical protein
MLMVVPRSFGENMQKLMKMDEEEMTAEEQVDEFLESLDIEIQDEDLLRRIKQSMREIYLSYMALQESSQKLAPETQVVHSAHQGPFYEISTDWDVSK